MPLREGSSRTVVSENIRTLVREGYPRRQALAIALSNSRRRIGMDPAYVGCVPRLSGVVGMVSEVGASHLGAGWKRAVKDRQKRLRRIELLNANVRDDALHLAAVSHKINELANVGCGPRFAGIESLLVGGPNLDAFGFEDETDFADGTTPYELMGDDETVDDEDEALMLLGGPADIVGFSLNPAKALRSISRAAKTVVRKAKNTAAAIPGVSPAVKTLAKVMQNPVVSTIYGPITVPGNLALGFAKNGPKGALDAAKMELRNPVRRAAVSALGTIFPPAAPAAVALNASNVLLDAYESKDPVAAAKAAAQLASIAAGSQAGDPHMKEIASVIDKVKTARNMIPKSAAPVLANARALVCGAKGEDSRGAWFKLNIRREGNRLVATLYSAAGGNAEVSSFSVDVRPFLRMASVMHARMHDGDRLTKAGQHAVLDPAPSGTVSGMLDSVRSIAEKLGTAKLKSIAAQKSNSIAQRAGCKVEKPPAPVSDAALATYAAARAGVEAVDNLKRVQGAVAGSTAALRKYSAVKKVLMAMPPEKRALALKKPEVRKAVIDGVAAKGTISTFVSAGGPGKMAEIRQRALVAQAAFKNVQAKARAGDPDAKKVAAVVSVAARARADVQNSAARSKGGLPGLVIGPNGRLYRGRFNKRAPNAGEGTSLIMTKQGLQAGVFDSVSGGNPLDIVAEDQMPFELMDVGGSATKVCCYGG